MASKSRAQSSHNLSQSEMDRSFLGKVLESYVRLLKLERPNKAWRVERNVKVLAACHIKVLSG